MIRGPLDIAAGYTMVPGPRWLHAAALPKSRNAGKPCTAGKERTPFVALCGGGEAITMRRSEARADKGRRHHYAGLAKGRKKRRDGRGKNRGRLDDTGLGTRTLSDHTRAPLLPKIGS